jgi:ABC-type transporter Mla subunit MlaD
MVPTMVTQGLRVRPSQAGIVGQSFLELFVADPAVSPIPTLNWTPRTPFIPATESTIEVIRTAAERIALQLERVNFAEVINGFEKLVGTLNQRVEEFGGRDLNTSIVETLQSIKTSSDRVNAVLSSKEVDQAIQDLPEIARRVRSAAEQMDSLLSSPQVQQAKDDLPEIAARIKSTSRQLDELLSSPGTKRILENLDTGSGRIADASQDIRTVVRLADGLLRQQHDDIQRIIAALRQTLDNTAELTEDAKQNPSRLIFGEPPPRREPTP